MERIKTGLEEYRMQYHIYPDSSQTFDRVANMLTPFVAGGVPTNDPWGELFIYKRPTRYSYSLYSAGPDRMTNTGDDVESSTAN